MKTKETVKLKEIKLVLASRNDKNPTIRSSQLKCKRSSVIVELIMDGIVCKSTFHISRKNTTYYGDGWSWRLPDVGNPIICQLISVTPIS